jgi:hypothetical protein
MGSGESVESINVKSKVSKNDLDLMTSGGRGIQKK